MSQSQVRVLVNFLVGGSQDHVWSLDAEGALTIIVAFLLAHSHGLPSE